MATNGQRAFEQGRQLERLNAFSDGIFAIAATLLVLTIEVPADVPAGDLSQRLDDLVEPLFVYFLSFAVVGLYWLRHHELFGRLERSDPTFAMVNLALLSFVALLPWPTELLGDYPDEPIAVALYAGNMVVIALTLSFLHRTADTHGLAHHASQDHVGRLRGVIVVVVFGASIPLAYVSPEAAKWSWLLVALLPPLAGRVSSLRAR